MGWGIDPNVKRNSQALGFVDLSLGRILTPTQSQHSNHRTQPLNTNKRTERDKLTGKYQSKNIENEEGEGEDQEDLAAEEKEDDEEEDIRIDVPLAITIFIVCVLTIFMLPKS